MESAHWLSGLLMLCACWGGRAEKETEYKHKEKVMLYVNKVGPYSNPSETYSYYALPVCRPDKIVHRTLSLGEVLAGDRMAESLFEIRFQVFQNSTELCQPYEVKKSELSMLKESLENRWYFEFWIDDLPIRGFIGELEQTGIFPHEHSFYLYTHYHFEFEYNGANLISAKVNLHKKPPVKISHDDFAATLAWSYSTSWKMTRTPYNLRRSVADNVQLGPKQYEIHWLSVLNSLLLTIMLVGFVVLILVRVVRSDLIRYNESEDADELENGWKVLSGDVFRFPNHRNLLCAIIGCGYQLLALVFLLLVLASLDLVVVYKRGEVYKTTAQLYAVTAALAGYCAGHMYRRLNGDRWWWNVNCTSALFMVPLFVIWAVLNTLWWASGSTRALPYTTIILMLILWLCVGYPVTLVGGLVGRSRAITLDVPCRTRLVARELPVLPWYKRTLFTSAGSGFLAFSAISVELYYVLCTVWGHELYTIYHVVLISVAVLTVVTACVSVAVTYFMLQAEDYRWWWRSVCTGGSTGVYVFVYSIYFYFRRSEMSGTLQTLQFFGYAALLSYAFFLALAAVSFMASERFVRYIYANVKTD